MNMTINLQEAFQFAKTSDCKTFVEQYKGFLEYTEENYDTLDELNEGVFNGRLYAENGEADILYINGKLYGILDYSAGDIEVAH